MCFVGESIYGTTSMTNNDNFIKEVELGFHSFLWEFTLKVESASNISYEVQRDFGSSSSGKMCATDPSAFNKKV